MNVHTGDVSGAGTDANVFMTIFGEKGDSGERKLHKSETYKDKFERAHVSIVSHSYCLSGQEKLSLSCETLLNGVGSSLFWIPSADRPQTYDKWLD